MASLKSVTAIEPVSNGGKATIDLGLPYTATFEVQGTAPILFHRWSVEAVAAKAAAAKGSQAKKLDNLESYVWRDVRGNLCIPGEYFRQSIINPKNGAAKYRQDPRSPRKSALDLYKAGIVVLDELCSLGIKKWDYEDQRRVVVNNGGITRVRPAVREWGCTVTFQVLTPEYIGPIDLNEIVQQAGRLVGVGDFRPTYGRFQVVKFLTSA